MPSVPSTARGTNRATSNQGACRRPLDKPKKSLSDWENGSKAIEGSLIQLRGMDSQIRKLFEIVDKMTDSVVQDALVSHLMPLQEILDAQLDIKKTEANIAQTCLEALHGGLPEDLGKDYMDMFAEAINGAPDSMTISQLRHSLTATMVAAEAHNKLKSKALAKGDQNASSKTKPEQEAMSIKKPKTKQASVFDPRPEKIRIVKKKSPPTKKTVPTTKITTKPRLLEKQLRKLFEDSKEDTVSRSTEVNREASFSFEPKKTNNAPKKSGSKHKAEENNVSVAETALLDLKASITKYEPGERVPTTVSTVQHETALSFVEKVDEEAMLSEVSPEPRVPSAHNELEETPVIITPDAKETSGSSHVLSTKLTAKSVDGRKNRRTVGMPGVAIPVPKKKRQRMLVIEVEPNKNKGEKEINDPNESVEEPEVTKKDEGVEMPETGESSATRDHSRQTATKSGSKRKYSNYHNTLPSKRPAIEGRNLASPRTRRSTPSTTIPNVMNIGSDPVPIVTILSSFAPSDAAGRTRMPFAVAMDFDDDDEL